jgi:SAM-dependent methyltransferase
MSDTHLIADVLSRQDIFESKMDGFTARQNMLELKIDSLTEALRRQGVLDFLTRRLEADEKHQLPQVVAPVAAPLAHELDDQLKRLEARAPLNFRMWMDRFEAARKEYEKRDRASLSVIDHPEAFYFGQFIKLHGRGNLLDIGVGPLALPSYLWGWPAGQLAGLDPLDAWEEHPFPFARSAAEFIPWGDDTFDTVVAATSIDHIYLLDVAMDEILRVLKPGGRFIVWSGIFADTLPYDPCAGLIDPPDAFHLFHPGENWFLPYLERYFRLIERLDISKIGYSNSFLSFEAKS